MSTDITRRLLKIGAATVGTLALEGPGVRAATWAPKPVLARETIGGGMKKVLVTLRGSRPSSGRSG